ncbi:MAG: hypothetical protein ACOCW6_05425, partial [Spirochaetota bacterium]
WRRFLDRRERKTRPKGIENNGNDLKAYRDLSDFSHRVVSGWIGIGRVVGALFLGVLFAAALGGVIVLPLWLLASRATGAYNVLVGLLLLVLLVIGLLRKLQGRTSRSLLPILRKTGVGIVGLGGVYTFAILVWEGHIWGAALLGLLCLVWLGASFGRRASGRSG